MTTVPTPALTQPALPLAAHKAPTHHALDLPPAMTDFATNGAASEYITPRLATILAMVHAYAPELDSFARSRCWEDPNLPKRNIPYGPLDYYCLSARYINVICGQSLQSMRDVAETKRLSASFANPHDHESSMTDLLRVIGESNTLAVFSLIRLKNLLQGHYGDAFPTDSQGTVTPVANVSLQELRCWCVLNASPIPGMVKNARGNNVELARLMENEVLPMMGSNRMHNLTKKRRFNNLELTTAPIPTPVVFFVCTGLNTFGDYVHDSVQVGATGERLQLWPEVQAQRDAARNELIGQPAQTAWKRRMLEMVAFAQASDEAAQENLRKAVMEEDWKSLGDEKTAEARRLLRAPLRKCGDHVGQSFTTTVNPKTIGCCWLCKMSMGYTEILPDNLDMAKVFRADREDVPHSCAEVPVSGRCVFATSIHNPSS